MVGVLLEVDDVAAVSGDERRHGGDDAAAVGTGDEQHGIGHRSTLGVQDAIGEIENEPGARPDLVGARVVQAFGDAKIVQ